MSFCPNCGEMTEENQQVCVKCGITLTGTEGQKASKRFFVPINYSDVKTIIPKGDKIIYSAVFNVSHPDPSRRSMFPVEFKTHVLLTERGMAFQLGSIKQNQYLPWNRLFQIFPGAMMVKIGRILYTFMFHTNPQYETPEEFEMRPWRFYFEFAAIAINEKKRTGITYNLKKIEKMWDKFEYLLGEEEIEFFRTNNDYNEFKKHMPKLQDALYKAAPKMARPFIKRYGLFRE